MPGTDLYGRDCRYAKFFHSTSMPRLLANGRSEKKSIGIYIYETVRMKATTDGSAKNARISIEMTRNNESRIWVSHTRWRETVCHLSHFHGIFVFRLLASSRCALISILFAPAHFDFRTLVVFILTDSNIKKRQRININALH